MRPDDIRKALKQQPFRPFRFYILEKTAFEVHHPDMVLVGRSTITFDVPTHNLVSPLAETAVTIALLHITRMEPLSQEGKPTSNRD